MSGAGCNVCGLIGCDCNAVADTFTASVCKVCRSSPCECAGAAVMPRTVGDNVCVKCHRRIDEHGKCLCISHAPVCMNHPAPDDWKPRRPYTDKQLSRLEDEGLTFYYAGDAMGLKRWLRQHLQ